MKKRFSLLILLFLITGCASQTNIIPEAKFHLKDVKNVSVVVETVFSSTNLEIETIEKKLIEKIKELNIFQEVSTKNDKSELIIKVQIEELIKVSKSDRFWFGAMAGRAKVAGKVTLIESFSGRILGSFYVEALSSGGTVLAGTTEQAIDKFVDKVISYIQENIIL